MAILDLTGYKLYKGINSNTDDNKHTAIIDAVNAFIEVYCGRVFTTYYGTDKTEYFNADDTELYPIEYPIVSVTSLEYSSDAGETYATALAQYTDYVIDANSESVRALQTSFASPAYPINALKLVYKGGYSAIPKDLEMAAFSLADYFVGEDYTPRKALAGATVDNVIQPDMTARLPAHIRRVLENYRSIAF